MQEPKYHFENGRVVNRASGETIPPDEPVMVFRGRDRNAVKLIEYYLTLCANEDHCEAVRRRIGDFKRFREANPSRMKEPDTELWELSA